MEAPDPTPSPASVRDDPVRSFSQQVHTDSTDEGWQRGLTPMILPRQDDEDVSDAPTVIAGGPEELPDLSDLFPIPGAKKRAPEPRPEAATASDAAPEVDAAVPAPEPQAPPDAGAQVPPATDQPRLPAEASSAPSAAAAPPVEDPPSPLWLAIALVALAAVVAVLVLAI